MATPLLVEFYLKLPQPHAGVQTSALETEFQDPMRPFREAILSKYTEGTLQRLLCSPEISIRRAAALAMGLIGTMQSNANLAAMLRDRDTLVRKFSVDSLWKIWFRAGTPEQNDRLQAAIQLPEPPQTLGALNELIRSAPDFAEPYNQRAALHARRGEHPKAVVDSENALRLNPFHFSAASGMGQSLLRMNRPKAALRAFKRAIEINPSIENVRETMRGLEIAGDDAARDAE